MELLNICHFFSTQNGVLSQTFKAFSLISTAWPSQQQGFFPLWSHHWKCWHNTRLLPKKHSSASGSRISVWPPVNPHPTQQCCGDVVRAPARRRTLVCRFVSAAEWKLCRTVVNSLAPSLWQWLNAGQQNARDEEGCWPCLKEWLKKHFIFFSPLDNMQDTWE